MFAKTILAALSTVALVAALPVPKPNALEARNGAGSAATAGSAWFNSNPSTGVSGYSDPSTYKCFSGPASSFPAFSEWMDYTTMFDLNQKASMGSFENAEVQGELWNAIQIVAADAQIDARLILAVIMQESTGNVNVHCTNNGVENCGLMQAYAGSVSYDPNNSQSSITQMVRDGTQGTSQGPGLVQWFNGDSSTSYAGSTDGNPFNVVRAYNSGSIDFNNLSDGKGSTNSYVSDIANRLLGWNGSGAGSSSCGF